MIYYDRQGKKINHDAYTALLEDKEYKVVRTQTIYGNLVSTVWIGIDHSFGIGPLLIFETMIFGNNSQWDSFDHRYSTESDALLGHTVIVDMLGWSYMKQQGRHEWVKVSEGGN